MTEIKMLPLPKWCYSDKHLHVGSGAIRKEVRGYSSAVAKHNVAARDAEIKALRADVEAWKASHTMLTDTCHHFQARAERLAEALRDGKQIVDEFLQCASIGRPHGKLIAQAKDWLADADAALAQQPAAVGEESAVVPRWFMEKLAKDTRDIGMFEMSAAIRRVALAAQQGGSDNDR